MRHVYLMLTVLAMGMLLHPAFAQEADSTYFTFEIGPGSPMSGTYQIEFQEDQAFFYNDFENDQYVMEFNGDNFISAMLIILKPELGKHPFTMEMQVAIDLSPNEGEDYYTFDNFQEEGGGYIQIDRLDDPGGLVRGSFTGKFWDGSTDSDQPILLAGSFSVKHM